MNLRRVTPLWSDTFGSRGGGARANGEAISPVSTSGFDVGCEKSSRRIDEWLMIRRSVMEEEELWLRFQTHQFVWRTDPDAAGDCKR